MPGAWSARVTWRGRSLDLTGLERRLLRRLANEPGRACSYRQLHTTVWQTPYVEDRSSLASAVKRLRRKLADAGTTVSIEAVRGLGFRLVSR